MQLNLCRWLYGLCLLVFGFCFAGCQETSAPETDEGVTTSRNPTSGPNQDSNDPEAKDDFYDSFFDQEAPSDVSFSGFEGDAFSGPGPSFFPTASNSFSNSNGGTFQTPQLDGTYRLSLSPNASARNRRVVEQTQSALLKLEGQSGTVVLVDPISVSLEGPIQFDSSGTFRATAQRFFYGSTIGMELEEARVTDNLIAGRYRIRVDDDEISGTFEGVRRNDDLPTDSAETIVQEVGTTPAPTIASQYNGRYRVEMNHSNVSYTSCWNFQDGGISGSFQQLAQLEGGINSDGAFRVYTTSSSPVRFSAAGSSYNTRGFRGSFSIDNITGHLTGVRDGSCQEAPAPPASVGQSSSPEANNSSNSNNDDTYYLCAQNSYAGIGDDKLVCRSKIGCSNFLSFREKQLNFDGEEDTSVTFDSYSACRSVCEDLAFTRNPNANSLESGLDIGNNFGECASPPRSELNNGSVLCLRDSLLVGGDNPLTCVPETEGCSFGIDSASVLWQIDERGQLDESHVFEDTASCNRTCKDLEFQDNPNASSLARFTGIGDQFASCESAPEPSPTVLCFSGLSTMYCRAESAGCSLSGSEELPFQRGFVLSILVSTFAQDLMMMKLDDDGNVDNNASFESFGACRETCESLQRQEIPNSSNIDLSAFIYPVGAASFASEQSLKYGFCRHL